MKKRWLLWKEKRKEGLLHGKGFLPIKEVAKTSGQFFELLNCRGVEAKIALRSCSECALAFVLQPTHGMPSVIS
jgi:hypothetical protein